MPNGLQFDAGGGAYGLHILHPDDGYLAFKTPPVTKDIGDIGAVGFWVRSFQTGDTFDMAIFAGNGGAAPYGGQTPRIEFHIKKDFGEHQVWLEIDNGDPTYGQIREIYADPENAGINIFDGEWHFILFQVGGPDNSPIIGNPPASGTHYYEIWVDDQSILDSLQDGNDYIGWFAAIQNIAGENFTALGLGASIGSPTDHFYEGCLDELFVFDYTLTPTQIQAIFSERLRVPDIATDSRFNFNNADPTKDGTPVDSWSFDLENPTKPIGYDSVGGYRDRLATEGGNQNTGDPDRDTARMDAVEESYLTTPPSILADIESGRTVSPSTGGYSGNFGPPASDVMLERLFQDSASQPKQWPQLFGSDLEDSGAISFWYKEHPGGGQGTIVNISDTDFTLNRFYIWISSGGQLRIAYTVGGTSTRVDIAGTNLDDNNWHHIVIVYVGSGQPYNIYIDGVLFGSFGSAGVWLDAVINESVRLGIGANNPSPSWDAWYIDAWLDNLCYHKNSLSLPDVQRLYNEGRNFPVHRWQYYHSSFPEKTSLWNNIAHCYTFDKAVDAMGNDHTGSHDFDLVGFPVDHSCDGITTSAEDVIFDAEPTAVRFVPFDSSLTTGTQFGASSLAIHFSPQPAKIVVDSDFSLDVVALFLEPKGASLVSGVEFESTPVQLEFVPSSAELVFAGTLVSFDIESGNILYTASDTRLSTSGRFDTAPAAIAFLPSTAQLVAAIEFASLPLQKAFQTRSAVLATATTFEVLHNNIDISASSSDFTITGAFKSQPSEISFQPSPATLEVDVDLPIIPATIEFQPSNASIMTGGEFTVDAVNLVFSPEQATLETAVNLSATPVHAVFTSSLSRLTTGTDLGATSGFLLFSPGNVQLISGEEFSVSPAEVLFTPSDAELSIGLPCVCPQQIFLYGLGIPFGQLEHQYLAEPVAIDFLPGNSFLDIGTDFESSPVELQFVASNAFLSLGTDFQANSVAFELSVVLPVDLITGSQHAVQPILLSFTSGEAELVIPTNIAYETLPANLEFTPQNSRLVTGTEFFAIPPTQIQLETKLASLFVGSEFRATTVQLVFDPQPVRLITTNDVELDAPPVQLIVDPQPANLSVPRVHSSPPVELVFIPETPTLRAAGEFISPPVSLVFIPGESDLISGSEFGAPPIELVFTPQIPKLTTGTEFGAEPPLLVFVPGEPRLISPGTFYTPPGLIVITPSPSKFPDLVERDFPADPGLIVLIPAPSELKLGDDPVFVYCVPDRQCTGRVRSRDILVMQKAEEFWVSFEFGPWLETSGNELESIENITTDGPFTIEREHWVDSEAIFRISIPADQEEGDFGIEIIAIDTEQNKLIVDGDLRIRDGLAI